MPLSIHFSIRFSKIIFQCRVSGFTQPKTIAFNSRIISSQKALPSIQPFQPIQFKLGNLTSAKLSAKKPEPNGRQYGSINSIRLIQSGYGAWTSLFSSCARKGWEPFAPVSHSDFLTGRLQLRHSSGLSPDFRNQDCPIVHTLSPKTQERPIQPNRKNRTQHSST